MRITIRVKPGYARPRVGGEHDGALIVRVSERAVDGKATEAALTAVADSFGVRRSAVRLVSGASSRTKIVDIDADDPRLLASLLAMTGCLSRRERDQPKSVERLVIAGGWIFKDEAAYLKVKLLGIRNMVNRLQCLVAVGRLNYRLAVTEQAPGE